MMIAYVDLEKRLSQSPLLRRIKTPADSALSEMDLTRSPADGRNDQVGWSHGS